jgi:hypothetical protein
VAWLEPSRSIDLDTFSAIVSLSRCGLSLGPCECLWRCAAMLVVQSLSIELLWVARELCIRISEQDRARMLS